MLEDTSALQAEYRRLTETVLPEQATADWPVQDDHCFQRIVLDTLCEGVWYDHLGRPAREHMTADQLREAIDIAASMCGDPDRVAELNRASLRYRNKL